MMIDWPPTLKDHDWLSSRELRTIVDKYKNTLIDNDRDRNKFWHEILPIFLVSEALGENTKIKYVGFSEKPFDAVFLVDDAEYLAECAIVDDVGRHHQQELIDEIKDEDGGWSPLRIALNIDNPFSVRKKKGGNYKIIAEEAIPSHNVHFLELVSRMCYQLYEKTSHADNHEYNISYIILITHEPPFCCRKTLGSSDREIVLHQMRLLAKISGKRIFFVGDDFVLDSEER